MGSEEASADGALKWILENGYWNSELVSVKSSSYGGLGVFLQPDAAVNFDFSDYSGEEAPEIILRVPKSNILSAKNSFLYSLLQEYELLDDEVDLRRGMHAMVVSYIYEKAAGPNSPWFDYLQSIESKSSGLDNVPLCLWPDELKTAMRNTECDLLNMLDPRELVGFFIECVRFSRFSEAVVAIPPVLNVNQSDLTVENVLTSSFAEVTEFGRQVQTVISRAFEVDEYHGLSLVPGADLFNHAFPKADSKGQEHVHFVSSNEVCEVCGELECDHDEVDEEGEDENDEVIDDGNEIIDDFNIVDDNDGASEAELDHDSDEDSTDMSDEEKSTLTSDEELQTSLQSGESCCDIILVNPPSSGELLNTYGNDLSNPYLLQRYGFVNPQEQSNPNDSCLLSVQMFSYLKNLKQGLNTKQKAVLEKKLAWLEEIGHEALNELLEKSCQSHELDDDSENNESCDPDCEDCAVLPDILDSWQLSIKVQFDGSPSKHTLAFLNLVKMKEKDFKTLSKAVDNNDISSFTRLLLVETNDNLNTINEWCQQRLKKYCEPPNAASIQASYITAIIGQEKAILNRAIQ